MTEILAHNERTRTQNDSAEFEILRQFLGVPYPTVCVRYDFGYRSRKYSQNADPCLI